MRFQAMTRRRFFEFVCSDTGLGMSEEFQKHAFESYAREGKETTNGYSGAGLGLSIVKHGALLHQAKVSMDSTVGEGTRISIVFSKNK